MAGFGHGFGSLVSGGRRLPKTSPNFTPLISPSFNWTGAAGSGFGEEPVDPVRATAKPAMRLLVPPNQSFVDELTVGVLAGANSNGTLADNLGLERVTVHYEGSSSDIDGPSFHTFTDANGAARTYWGWWATLKHNNINGLAKLYFEAVPQDATMQNRVIGPYLFLPSAAEYDLDIQIAPSLPEVAGARYQSTGAAMGYLRQSAARHPRVTFVESGNYDFSNPGVSYEGQGYVTFEASVPVTITRAVADPADTSLRTRFGGMRFRGANITIDFVNLLSIYAETGRNVEHWFDGCNLTNSAGRNSLFFKNHRDTLNLIVYGNPYFTECTITKLHRFCNSASLARGNITSETWSDMFTGASCVVGNVSSDHDSSWHRQYVEALRVEYTGPGVSATLQMSGSNNAPTRVLTAKVDGLIVGSFTVTRSASSYVSGANYHVHNVVDWFNSLADWSATLLDDTRLATSLQMFGAVGAWSGAEANGGASLYTYFDVHADYAQTAGENAVIAFNSGYALGSQDLFFTNGDCRDFLVFNNAFHNVESVELSQVNRNHSHVVVAHNTLATQPMLLRTDSSYNADGYCLMANNVFKSIFWGSGQDPDQLVTGNHTHEGSVVPDGAIDHSTGGDDLTLFTAAAAGDFAPIGSLLANVKEPVIKINRLHLPRGHTAPAGAD